MPINDKKPFKILSIDGGGILGISSIAFLAVIENKLRNDNLLKHDENIGQYFDLISGTSTGGIIAIAIGLGLEADKIKFLYYEKGGNIFQQDKIYKNINNLIYEASFKKIPRILPYSKPKYDSNNLKQALKEQFNDKKLGESKTRLIIPGWDDTNNKPVVFKTRHHKKYEFDHTLKALDVALATSAAPTYFKPHIIQQSDRSYIDGGIWCNNPTLAAVVEAIGVLRKPIDDIYVLSLGCIKEVFELPDISGIIQFAPKVLKTLMKGQSISSINMSKLLLNNYTSDKVFRIEAQFLENTFPMDDTSKINKLCGIGNTLAQDNYSTIKDIFFKDKAATFQPEV